MKCVKNVDLGMMFKALAKALPVVSYMDVDIPMDINTIRACAESMEPKDKLLWYQLRPCGTWLVNARNAFIESGGANAQWLNEARNGNAGRVKSYIVVPQAVSFGVVTGDIYTLDYAKSVKDVERLAYRPEDDAVEGSECNAPYPVESYLQDMKGCMQKAKEVDVSESFVA